MEMSTQNFVTIIYVISTKLIIIQNYEKIEGALFQNEPSCIGVQYYKVFDNLIMQVE